MYVKAERLCSSLLQTHQASLGEYATLLVRQYFKNAKGISIVLSFLLENDVLPFRRSAFEKLPLHNAVHESLPFEFISSKSCFFSISVPRRLTLIPVDTLTGYHSIYQNGGRTPHMIPWPSVELIP